jgi:hypothetical protein
MVGLELFQKGIVAFSLCRLLPVVELQLETVDTQVIFVMRIVTQSYLCCH